MNKHYVYDKSEAEMAVVVFAHGAGANMSSAFMEQVSKRLVAFGISVVRFNFPYMERRAEDGKRRPPDRMPKLIDDMENLITQLDTKLPLFLGGKSMGSRVSASLSAQCHEQVKGIFALGYPFHPIGKPDKTRLEPLEQTQVPILIVQGERDKLGSKDEISQYSLGQHCHVKFLPDGDHDLKPRVKSGFTHDEHIASACQYIKDFVDEHC